MRWFLIQVAVIAATFLLATAAYAQSVGGSVVPTLGDEETGGDALTPATSTAVARGEQPASAADRYDLYLITMGPGDELFSRYGHNAILVVDHEHKYERVYNFGTFAFNDPELISKFLRALLTYWLSVSTWKNVVGYYVAEDRTLWRQPLLLPRADEERLVHNLIENARRENREYIYHFYLNNCSTKVRDHIDAVTDGRFKAAFSSVPVGKTFRDFTSEGMAVYPWVATSMYIVMNDEIDVPLTRWDEMFLPEKVMERVLEFQYTDRANVVQQISGPLTLLHERRREFQWPNPWLTWFAIFVLPLAGLMLWSRAGARRASRRGDPAGNALDAPRVLRHAGAFALGAWGFYAALFAASMLVFWIFSGHTVTSANANLWLLPLTHVYLLSGLRAWVRVASVRSSTARRAKRRAKLVRIGHYLLAHTAVAAVYTLIYLTGLTRQVTAPVILMTFVLNLSAIAMIAARVELPWLDRLPPLKRLLAG